MRTLLLAALVFTVLCQYATTTTSTYATSASPSTATATSYSVTESTAYTAATNNPSPGAYTAPEITTTYPPQSQRVAGFLKAKVTGDSALIPPPVANNSVVLYSTERAFVELLCTFNNSIVLPKEALIQNVSISFKITYITGTIDMRVLLRDELGTLAANATKRITEVGTVIMDITTMYANLISIYKQSFTIRAIHGTKLYTSLDIITSNVTVNIEQESVTSSFMYSVQNVTTQAPAVVVSVSSTLHYCLATLVAAVIICAM